MRITAAIAAVLIATAVLTAGPAYADPRSEVQQLQQQTADLHASWDGLSPAQRQQRLDQLSRQTTVVQRDIDALPADQKPEVQAMLGQVVIQLADLLGRAWPRS